MPNLPGFTPLTVTPDLEIAPWSDLRRDEIQPGTVQGRAVVELYIRTEDGQVVIAETTWRLFHAAARALAASPTAAEEDPGA